MQLKLEHLKESAAAAKATRTTIKAKRALAKAKRDAKRYEAKAKALDEEILKAKTAVALHLNEVDRKAAQEVCAGCRSGVTARPYAADGLPRLAQKLDHLEAKASGYKAKAAAAQSTVEVQQLKLKLVAAEVKTAVRVAAGMACWNPCSKSRPLAL